jgi:hypothetical protein
MRTAPHVCASFKIILNALAAATKCCRMTSA